MVFGLFRIDPTRWKEHHKCEFNTGNPLLRKKNRKQLQSPIPWYIKGMILPSCVWILWYYKDPYIEKPEKTPVWESPSNLVYPNPTGSMNGTCIFTHIYHKQSTKCVAKYTSQPWIRHGVWESPDLPTAAKKDLTSTVETLLKPTYRGPRASCVVPSATLASEVGMDPQGATPKTILIQMEVWHGARHINGLSNKRVKHLGYISPLFSWSYNL